MNNMRITTRQQRVHKILNCLMGAYSFGGINVRDISFVTRIPEPRISEIVSELEEQGVLTTVRDGKSRIINLARHPVEHLREQVIPVEYRRAAA